MSDAADIELFILKCAALNVALQDAFPTRSLPTDAISDDEKNIKDFIHQFSHDVRMNASKMAEYYKIFYMLENDIRKLIDGTLTENFGVEWWDLHSPPSAKEECRLNQLRERDAGITSRSESELDYISFGQLGDIIRFKWDVFGGILSNQKALNRVMTSLNTLRGPIAHCGVLAEDEVDRLKLTIKDWFRLLEGPKP